MRWGLGIVVAVVVLLVGAFWTFSTPDIPRAVLEAKYATPPSEFLVLPDGARAHVRDVGPRNAETIVLIHGFGESLFVWGPWGKRLSGTFRVVTFDLPGYGLTGAVPNGDYSQAGMAAFVKEVADKLHLSRFTLVGHSMGGGVAARFAEMYPSRVSHLILVDAEGMPYSGSDGLLSQLAKTPVLGNLMLYITPRSFVASQLDDAVAHKDLVTDKRIDRFWEFLRMTGSREAVLAHLRLPHDTYVHDHVRQIDAPVLLLWGADDRLIPIAHARMWARALPAAKLIVYPKTGHIPQIEVPDRSGADVRVFLTAPITPPQPY